MKEYLRRLITDTADPGLKRSITREYLQARVLQCLQEKGAFINWAFLGGTALRFLYSMPRYSEDLDFSVISTDQPAGFREQLNTIQAVFSAEGYDVSVKLNDRKTVASAFIRFKGLLNELGISPLPDQVLSVKLEVDTNPPAGAVTRTTLVRKYIPLNLHHYDKASLLAGKIHALLSRPYAKGRDLYDLVWYLADRSWPEPNMELLGAALRQTEWPGPEPETGTWRDILRKKMEGLDWKAVTDDVRPFLERGQDVRLLDKSTVLELLQSHPV